MENLLFISSQEGFEIIVAHVEIVAHTELVAHDRDALK